MSSSKLPAAVTLAAAMIFIPGTAHAATSAGQARSDRAISVKILDQPAAVSDVGHPQVKILSELSVKILGEPSVKILSEPTVKILGEPSVKILSEPTVKILGEPSVKILSKPDVVLKTGSRVKIL